MKNRILRLSATDAARDFSRLLDRVEAGAEAIIERHSEPVAVIGPAHTAPRKVSECLAAAVARPPSIPDPDFAKDMEEIIQAYSTGELASWD
jgi:prevent-host-death family protein